MLLIVVLSILLIVSFVFIYMKMQEINGLKAGCTFMLNESKTIYKKEMTDSETKYKKEMT